MRHFFKHLYYFPRMKGGKEGRRRKGGRTTLSHLGLKHYWSLISVQNDKFPLQKERLSCEILSAPPFKCHVLPSFPWWRARTIKSTYISESNMLHSKPTLPHIRSTLPKVWARSPLGTQGAFQCIHEVNIIFIIMLICHVPFSPSFFS